MHLSIALLRLPGLLADVVESAFSDDDAQFDRLGDPDMVATRALSDRRGHDAVIAGVDDAWQADVLAIKRANPALVVMGLRNDGRTTWLYELVPRPRALGELGPAELRGALVSAIDAPAT